MLCLPPNNTHILQLLDVGVFWPVKSSWRKIVKNYKLKMRAANITKDVFPQLVKKLLDCTFTPSKLKAGFKSAGVVP